MRHSTVGAAGLLAAVSLVTSPASAGSQPVPGVGLDAAYTADVISNVRGGIETGTAALGNLDVTVRVDGGELVGWDATTLFVYVLGNHGAEASGHVGDAQVVSNIEAPSALRLYEAWVEKDFRDERLSLLFGLYDLNSEFDVLPSADLFLNSSFGIGAEFAASCVNGPSIFPVTSLSLRGKWKPSTSLYVQGAVLDGVAGDPSDPGSTHVHLSAREGALLVGEVGWIARAPVADGEERASPRGSVGPVGRGAAPGALQAKVAVGVWNYTREARALDPGRTPRRIGGRPGFYLLGQWMAHREAPGAGQGLVLSARAGLADPRTNRFVAYTGGAAVYTGPLPGRPADELGIGVAAAHNGADFMASRRADGRRVTTTETALELTYRIQEAGWALQPDLQYVLRPDTDPTRTSALVLGLRGEVELF